MDLADDRSRKAVTYFPMSIFPNRKKPINLPSEEPSNLDQLSKAATELLSAQAPQTSTSQAMDVDQTPDAHIDKEDQEDDQVSDGSITCLMGSIQPKEDDLGQTAVKINRFQTLPLSKSSVFSLCSQN